MKKIYQKPTAFLQNLQVNSFCAGACSGAGGSVVASTEDTCSYSDSETGFTFFSTNCADGSEWGLNIVSPNAQSPAATICYHRPLNETSFFNS